MTEEHRLIAERREKLNKIRELGIAFPNDVSVDALASDLHKQYDGADGDELKAQGIRVRVAGRMMSRRVMGKASFAQLQDRTGRIQIYVQRDALPEGVYNTQFKSLWDVGDILAGSGTLFITKTGELTVQVDELRLLTKSLRPLPDKFHGLTDQEMRYRQRYVDLIMNDQVRDVFIKRAAIVKYIRQFMEGRDFLEVETPMMHHIPGGAAAKPFKTFHNALGIELYLRVAPELHLKRLTVGGLERVYEINRNFRNEGVSTKHNPEFTMLEFYWAYATYEELIDLTESMLRGLAQEVAGNTLIDYQGTQIDFGSPFARVSLKEAVQQKNPSLDGDAIDDKDALLARAEQLGIKVSEGWGNGRLQMEIFEATVEEHLVSPTFVTQYPTEVSPLSRRNDANPEITDRFELFIMGREIANGFSELNDPEDQAERFRQQVAEKDAGDEEAMHFDADYIRALEYGLPPTAGEGVGIDRLVMLLTDSPSIRDVLLFPYMRPET